MYLVGVQLILQQNNMTCMLLLLDTKASKLKAAQIERYKGKQTCIYRNVKRNKTVCVNELFQSAIFFCALHFRNDKTTTKQS